MKSKLEINNRIAYISGRIKYLTEKCEDFNATYDIDLITDEQRRMYKNWYDEIKKLEHEKYILQWVKG